MSWEHTRAKSYIIDAFCCLLSRGFASVDGRHARAATAVVVEYLMFRNDENVGRDGTM